MVWAPIAQQQQRLMQYSARFFPTRLGQHGASETISHVAAVVTSITVVVDTRSENTQKHAVVGLVAQLSEAALGANRRNLFPRLDKI